MSLSEKARQARECGLDYGNYVAKLAQGYTYAQLYELAHPAKRQCCMCGADFEPAVHNQLCCSPACSKAAKRLRAKRYYRKQAEKYRARSRERYHADKERWKALARAWKKAHPDYQRKWQKAHPEKLLEYKRRYRLKKKEGGNDL